ncbi:MAG: acetylxylan esterase, partial [Clostridia bacterium]
MRKKFNYKMMLVISLCLMLVGMTFAGLVQTSFGQVDVKEISMDTDVGTLTGYLLVPKTAKTGEKLPAIVTSHGYLNNREMQDINYVELSRRGFVVFAMNAYAHGDSSVVVGENKKTINAKTGGMVDAVEYLATLPYVDVTRIGVTGHSMGGGYTNSTMEYYSNLEKEALAKGMSAKDAKALNKIAAGVIVGNFPSNLTKVAETDGSNGYLTNLAVIGAKFDEFYLGMTGGVYGKDILSSDT